MCGACSCLLVGVQCDGGRVWARRFSEKAAACMFVSSGGEQQGESRRRWEMGQPHRVPTSLGNIGPGSVVDAATASWDGQDHSPALFVPLGGAAPHARPRPRLEIPIESTHRLPHYDGASETSTPASASFTRSGSSSASNSASATLAKFRASSAPQCNLPSNWS